MIIALPGFLGIGLADKEFRAQVRSSVERLRAFLQGA